MIGKALAGTVGASCMLAAAAAGPAGAMTLGTTDIPAGAPVGNCISSAVIAATASEPATPYTVPTAGMITAWRTSTATGATAGGPLTLVVLRPNVSGAATVVGSDAETLPTPLPADDTASFSIAVPIAVQAGDMLALYSTASSGTACYSVASPANTVQTFGTVVTLIAGTVIPELTAPAPGARLNLAATFVPDDDAGVSASAGPADATAGALAQLGGVVTNNGPGSAPITVTDTVPAGLAISSAVAGNGSCAVAGQQVTCTITGLAAGRSAPFVILVTPSAAGSYENAASVAVTDATDRNAANDRATATLTVAPKPAPQQSPPKPKPTPKPSCVVPTLTRTPLAVARDVLGKLSCKPGKVTRAYSRIAKGTVVATKPGRGIYANGTAVRLVVSSGPKPKPKKKQQKAKPAKHGRR